MPDDEARVTVHGKQLKMDGEHLADCRDDEAAAVIALCLNFGLLVGSEVPPDGRERVEAFFA